VKLSSHLKPARAALALPSDFVRFPERCSRRQLLAQAIVLSALTRDEVQPVAGAGLVLSSASTSTMALGALPSTKTYTNPVDNPSSEPWIRLQVTDNTSTLRQVLFHSDAYLYNASFLRSRNLYLDSRHLRATTTSWEDMPWLTRYLVVASALHSDCSWAVSVNFASGMLKRLDYCPDPLRHLRNQLSAVAKHGDLFLALERTEENRLHAHGIMRSEADLPQIRRMLRVLGGHSCDRQWKNGYQVKVVPLRDALGWSQYMFKSLLHLPAPEFGRHVYVSREAKRLARAHVGALRQRADQKFGSRPVRRSRLACSHVGRGTASCLAPPIAV